MKEAPFFRRLPPLRRLLWMHQVTGGSSSILKTVTGTLLHITDALAKSAKKFVATLEPIQDLHGYDNPWPAGGGVNVLDPQIKFENETQNDVTLTTTNGYVLSLTGTASDACVFRSNIVTLDKAVALPAGTYSLPYGWTVQIRKPSDASYIGNYTGTFTASESFFVYQTWLIVSSGVTTNFTRFASLAKGSSALTSWSPYSNICPITGHTGANVVRTGKNLYDKVNHPFESYSGRTDVCWTSPIFLKKGTYTFTCNDGFGRCYLNVYGTYNDAVNNVNKISQDNFTSNSSRTNTFTSDVYIRYQQNTVTGSFADVSNAWQTEIGSSATTYELYSGTTIPINFDAIVPSDYQPVEYIESTGTQYIDTGIECTSDLVVEFKAQATVAQNTAICGGINASNNPIYFRHHFSPYNGNAYWIQNDSLSTASVYQSGVDTALLTVKVDPTNGTAVINGTNKTFTALPNNLTTGKSYGLFGRISDTGDVQYRASRIYYFKFYRNSQLIGDFIPCYRKSDDVAGMYDTVTKTFFTNDGTGDFVVGDAMSFYGCTLTNDGEKWQITVDTELVSFDGTENTWEKYGTGTILNGVVLRNTVDQTFIRGLCSHVPNSPNNKAYIDGTYITHVNAFRGLEIKNVQTNFGLPDNEVSTWKSFLATQAQNGTPFQVLAYLQNPITYTLTESQALALLKGENNIWVDDSDDLELTYYAKAEETP